MEKFNGKCMKNTTNVVDYVLILFTILKNVCLFVWYLLLHFFFKFYSPKKVINNQVVLITGSAGYLGRKLALEFARKGLTLVLWDIDSEGNKKTYDAVRECGHRRVYAYKVDLSCEQEVRQVSQKVKTEVGDVSIIVLAAATVCAWKPVLELDDAEQINKSFKVFYKSHIWIYQEFVPRMIEKNEGHLVLISSEAVFTNLAFLNLYSSLKCSQVKLFECIDSELNYNPSNKINTTIVFLGGLKSGISSKICQYLNTDDSFLNEWGLCGEKASKKIVEAIMKNKKRVYLPRFIYLFAFAKYLLPYNCFELLFGSKNFIKINPLESFLKINNEKRTD